MDMPAPQLTAEVESLTKMWGFNPRLISESVRAAAQFTLECKNLLSGQLVAKMGLADEADIELLLFNKPKEVPTLEYLAEHIPGVRNESSRMLCAVHQLAFLHSLDSFAAHPGNTQIALRSRLNELNAVLLQGCGAAAILCFSDFATLVAYRQRGRVERLKDPLETVTQGKAVLVMSTIQNMLPFTPQSEDAPINLSSTTQDNHWASQLAKTDAERVLGRLLDGAIEMGVTDLSLEPLRNGSSMVFYRQYGDIIKPPANAVLGPDLTSEIVRFLVTKSRAGDGARLRAPADGQITYKSPTSEVYIRASFIPADRSGLDLDMLSVSLRLLARTANNVSLHSLGLQPFVTDSVQVALKKTQGLVVLAGPTGSGKSTTIAGIMGEHIQMYGQTRKRLSLEDPVERYLANITQISTDGKFGVMMKNILRHDPDVIWVGEIRDRASAAACVRASTSGHLVLSTVHANSSVMAFSAIANYLTGMATDDSSACSAYDLAESLSLIVAQRLVKRVCPSCGIHSPVEANKIRLFRKYLESEGMGMSADALIEKIGHETISRNPAGCRHCQQTGYVGEIPINECLPVNREVKNLLSGLHGPLDYLSIAQHRESSLVESAVERLSRGEIEFDSVFL